MDVEEIGCEYVYWIHLPRDVLQWLAVTKAVMKRQVPEKAVICLTRRATTVNHFSPWRVLSMVLERQSRLLQCPIVLFFQVSGPAPGLANLLFKGYRGLFRRSLSGRDMKPTTHLHLVPRLRISGAIPSLHRMILWGVLSSFTFFAFIVLQADYDFEKVLETNMIETFISYYEESLPIMETFLYLLVLRSFSPCASALRFHFLWNVNSNALAACYLNIALGFIAVTNEPLEQGVSNLVWR
jgi:hypothetical protein